MIDALNFVNQWRQNHAWEVMTIEGLARMLEAYEAEVRSDEQVRLATVDWLAHLRSDLSDKIDDLDWGHDQLERPTVLVADVKALLGGGNG